MNNVFLEESMFLTLLSYDKRQLISDEETPPRIIVNGSSHKTQKGGKY
jgi:hypothetical protein